MASASELKLSPGTYSLTVENDRINFQAGKKKYSIYKDYLMNHEDAPINCFEECSKAGKVYPLKQYPSNRFTLGVHAEIEIVVHFNHIQILRNHFICPC